MTLFCGGCGAPRAIVISAARPGSADAQSSAATGIAAFCVFCGSALAAEDRTPPLTVAAAAPDVCSPSVPLAALYTVVRAMTARSGRDGACARRTSPEHCRSVGPGGALSTALPSAAAATTASRARAAEAASSDQDGVRLRSAHQRGHVLPSRKIQDNTAPSRLRSGTGSPSSAFSCCASSDGFQRDPHALRESSDSRSPSLPVTDVHSSYSCYPKGGVVEGVDGPPRRCSHTLPRHSPSCDSYLEERLAVATPLLPVSGGGGETSLFRGLPEHEGSLRDVSVDSAQCAAEREKKEAYARLREVLLEQL